MANFRTLVQKNKRTCTAYSSSRIVTGHKKEAYNHTTICLTEVNLKSVYYYASDEHIHPWYLLQFGSQFPFYFLKFIFKVSIQIFKG